MKTLKILTTAALFSLGFLPGCSSVATKDTQELEVLTSPEQCSILITDNRGKKIFEGCTPSKVQLSKSNGYFEGCTYEIHLEKGGYQAQDIVVKSKNNAWYVFGNTLNGFIPGWLGIDSKLKTMHELTPFKLEVHMTPVE